jgi:hypothetical protein
MKNFAELLLDLFEAQRKTAGGRSLSSSSAVVQQG